jgi:hypothetical protein
MMINRLTLSRLATWEDTHAVVQVRLVHTAEDHITPGEPEFRIVQGHRRPRESHRIYYLSRRCRFFRDSGCTEMFMRIHTLGLIDTGIRPSDKVRHCQ